MKILAFAGSNSSSSINKQLVQYVSKSFADAEINLLDLRDFEVEIFSVDKEKLGFPPEVKQFIAAIAESDAIICALAEHNRGFCAAFKNLLDWCSRVQNKFFQDKKMILMSSSPGGFGGGNVMAHAQNIFPNFGAQIISTFSLPKFYENFDVENGVINAALTDELNEKIHIFKQSIIV